MSWLSVIVSLIIGFALGFNSATVPILIVSTIIFSTLVFFIIRSFASFKEHRARSVLQALLLIVIVLIVFVIVTGRISIGCAVGPVFSTNSLTGECVVTACTSPQGWYYESGCALSDDERMELLEREGWFDRPRESCMQRCEQNSSLFCEPGVLFHEFRIRDLTCSDLVDCDIECPTR